MSEIADSNVAVMKLASIFNYRLEVNLSDRKIVLAATGLALTSWLVVLAALFIPELGSVIFSCEVFALCLGVRSS